MASIDSLLKSEIVRLCRKQLKVELEPLRKASAGYRRDIAVLKREAVELKKQLASAQRRSGGTKVEEPKDGPVASFHAGRFKSWRAKMGLSQADVALLGGVAAQSVYKWEGEHASPRAAQAGKIDALRAFGKQELTERLAAAKRASKPKQSAKIAKAKPKAKKKAKKA